MSLGTNFEFYKAVVCFDHPLAKLFVQAFDAYGFCRELYVKLAQPDLPTSWTLSAYQQPGRRSDYRISQEVADYFVKKFRELVESKSRVAGFFPAEGAKLPPCQDFVKMMEALHREHNDDDRPDAVIRQIVKAHL
jgi:hypothetical protein